MSKKCSYCGAELMDEAAFCPYCAKSQIVKTAIKVPVLWRKKAAIAVMAAFCVFLVVLIPRIPSVPEKQEMFQPPQTSSEEVSSQSSEADNHDELASNISSENWTWVLDSEGTLTISGKGIMSDPDEKWPWESQLLQIKKIEIEEGVTEIGRYAFAGCKSLTSVTVPESVTRIRGFAFEECESLTSIVIPKSLTYFGGYAFKGCSALTSVAIPEGIEIISEGVFKYCSSLTSITIPKAVTSIPPNMFSGCSALADIIFEGSAPEISDSAFDNVIATAHFSATDTTWTMDKLQNYGGTLTWNALHAPGEHNMNSVVYEKLDEVSHVQKTVCPGCPDHYEITVGTEPHSIDAEGDRAANSFSPAYCSLCGSEYGECLELPANMIDCGIIDGMTWELTDDGTLTLSGEGMMPDIDDWPWESYKPQIKKAVIEEGITNIGRYVFSNCKALTSVTLPESLERIRGYAFRGCSALPYIDIPESVYYLGGSSFEGCSAFTEFTVPEAVTKTSSYAVFKDCRSLTSITLPDGLLSIPNATFMGCSSLTSITIPESVTSIRDLAFSGCTSLREIVFEGSVPYISDDAFNSYGIIDAYYPADDASWTEEVLKNYDFLNWHPYSRQN